VTGCKYHGVAFVGPTARGAVRRCVVEGCQQNGVLLRDGASPTLDANRLASNGQFGAALLDCRGRYLDSNQASRNGKGAVSGECDDVDDV
jgi:parallel beta-helix repeat protein